MFITRLAILTVIIGISKVYASTSSAWAIHDKDFIKFCLTKSTLKEKKTIGQRVDFDDNAAMSAILISGRYYLKENDFIKTAELCLYNRSTGRIYIEEIGKFPALEEGK
ncbi:hypothetical protein EEI76_23030 (plasmid) [Enterobacter cloacae]|nr:hypothetical protein EEI76_23030 [Enterobacter cloacae]